MKTNKKTRNILPITALITILFTALITSCGAGGAAGGGGDTTPTTQEICGFDDIENGALHIRNMPDPGTTFSAGLLGTFDRLDTGQIVGGMDWMYTSEGDFSTTSMATQIISPWSRKSNRNTELQISNQSLSQSVTVHVQIFDENCVEIRDFCDQYTPLDTHIYDFSDILSNAGSAISSSILTGKEGFVAVTPNVNCGTDYRAISFRYLSGDVRITDSAKGFQYGTRAYARDSDTATSCTETIAGSKVLTGSGNCKLKTLLPDDFIHVFSQNPNTDQSRADLIFISMSDNYSSSGYNPIGANTQLSPLILNEDELAISCPLQTACYLRLGLDQSIKDSDVPLPPPGSLCDSSAPGAIIGTPGDDTLSGTGGDDVIIGLGGNDTITGGSGSDCIDGGPGNDSINAGSQNDTVYGGRGDDTIDGGGGNDKIDGGPDNDTIDGGGGTDTCTNGESLNSC
jgi:hypothetical protein